MNTPDTPALDPALTGLAEKISQDRQALIERGIFTAAAGQETAPSADPAPAALESAPPGPAPIPEAAPPSPAPAAPEPAPAGDPAPAAPARNWEEELAKSEQRFRTADGILKAQSQEMQALRERLRQMEETQRPAPAPAPASPPPPGPSPALERVRSKLEAEFGRDAAAVMLESIEDLTAEKVSAALPEAIEPFRKELEPVKQTAQQMAQAQAARAAQEYASALQAGAADAFQIAEDTWYLTEPLVGALSELGGLELLHQHHQARNAKGVLDLINLAKRHLGAAQPPGPAPQAPAPTQPSALQQRSDQQRAAIAAQAQPRPGGASASPAQPKTYSYEAWRAGKRDLAIPGKYSPEQRTALLAEYDAAYREGRVSYPQ